MDFLIYLYYHSNNLVHSLSVWAYMKKKKQNSQPKLGRFGFPVYIHSVMVCFVFLHSFTTLSYRLICFNTDRYLTYLNKNVLLFYLTDNL